MTAEQACRHVMENMGKSMFVDTRTPSELNYLGIASVLDAHVPTFFSSNAGCTLCTIFGAWNAPCIYCGGSSQALSF